MDIRLTNLTGLELHYKILDFEGPFANFAEQLLPGQYPAGQNTYTDSDPYYNGNNTRVGDQRYTLSSRYPRFNASTEYLPGNFSQRPSHRSYEELRYQYPLQRLTSFINGKRKSRMLDGNREGIIPKGLHRDILLKDINCNIELTTIGRPTVTSVVDPDGYIQSNGKPITSVDAVIENDDPRYNKYKAIIKVARLREGNVLACLAINDVFYMYDSFGVRIQLEYTNDVAIIPLYSINTISRANTAFASGTPSIADGYGQNAQPATTGTYIDGLRNNYFKRKRNYGRQHPDMTSSNYSNDYDEPILGYFDRRWMNYQ
jgi:hypothetical protein